MANEGKPSLLFPSSDYVDAQSVSQNVFLKFGSCAALLFFSVSATLFTEASKSAHGIYPYNSFMIPCTVEVLKLCVSAALLVLTKLKGYGGVVSFSLVKFSAFCLPAMCYFVSNNCMFYIIRELGPTTFQITNNLKVLSTGVLMRLFLGRKLSWLRWKALLLLVIGSTVSQLSSSNNNVQGSAIGYNFVLVNSISAGAGGVISEKLLKGPQDGVVDSIHWQNMQLFFFGVVFGIVSSISKSNTAGNIFEGFNSWAYAAVASLTAAGLLVSFILKYLDNFAKCFVSALSILVVAVVHAGLQNQSLPLQVVLGIALTCMALEQYNLSP